MGGRTYEALQAEVPGDNIASLCNTYILLDVLLGSIAEYFYVLCRILTSP